jgi:ribosomal protein L24
MRKLFLLSALFIMFGGVFTNVKAQADLGIKPNFAGGEVTSVTTSKIVLETKDGVIEVVLSDATAYKKVSPENPSLKTAVESKLSDVGVGDKLLVTGAVSEDKKTIPAKIVYLMTKSDIAQRQVKESEEWKTRGLSGKVLSVDPATKEIIVSSKGIAGETKTTLTPKENAKYHRYAPNSVKFSEAKDSNLGEISSGDMIRALGDKGENNTFKAEEIVTGAFQTTAGTVTAIDAEKNEVTVTDIQTKKPVTIVVSQTSILKQFPAEMAQRLAMMQTMRASGAQPPTGGGQGNRPPQGNTAGQGEGRTNGAGQGGGMRGGGSIDEMLERFPNITVADLKVGDMIAVSSSKTANSEKITAIKLLSGVEPFLKVPQMAGGGRGGRGGGGQDINIPGLDDGGFGNP